MRRKRGPWGLWAGLGLFVLGIGLTAVFWLRGKGTVEGPMAPLEPPTLHAGPPEALPAVKNRSEVRGSSRNVKKEPSSNPRPRHNRLIREKSPYLLQHADNPVDWFPWGEEAFQKSRQEDRPILLSIGYSTCHWCHVMEHESYEDPEVAAVLNKHFVSIKVDREERPDVDKIYMTAANGAGWGGGWPLNMFLTPDLKPFFGGTYFPPEPRWGRPGFKQLLEHISKLWETKRPDLMGDANRVARALEQHVQVVGGQAPLDAAWLDKAFESFRSSFDAQRGGFGDAPKFPMPVNHNFLLRYFARTQKAQALEMVKSTLREMSRGGIYDHVGGGFARYSVDGNWRVPHFEKMLYDNAQVAVNYLEAYQVTKEPDFARVAAETLGYVLRDMTHPKGGFFSAEDADSVPPELAASGKDQVHKSEGAFYLWTKKEIDRVLGNDLAPLFAYRYGVHSDGNAPADPQGEFTGKNILYAAHTLAETARKFNLKEAEAGRRLRQALAALREVRSNRPRPGLDDKVLTSWNGLMISAFAKGYQILEDPASLQAAQKAARFLQENLVEPKTGRLHHSWREGERGPKGMADDYAFLIQGLIDLYESDFDPGWLEWVVRLTEQQNRLFFDKEDGGYYMTAEDHDENLLVRMKEDADNVEPAASSVAALNLLRLAQFTDRQDFRERAEKTLALFGPHMARIPRAVPQMLVAADFALSNPKQVVLAGGLGDPGMLEMLRAVRSRFIPAKIVVVVEGGPFQKQMAKLLPFFGKVRSRDGKPTAFVCIKYACELPTTDLSVLNRILDGKRPAGNLSD